MFHETVKLTLLLDSPELFDGVPLALQLVGKHFQDEDLLRAAKLVEDVMRK